jgi:hypothetical protein
MRDHLNDFLLRYAIGTRELKVRSQIGQAKIEDFGVPPLGHENIGRFDVAMNDAPGMSRWKAWMRTTASSRFGFMENQCPVTVWQPTPASNPELHLLADGRQSLPWDYFRVTLVIREQSRESSLIECEETVNSTKSWLSVHFQRKVQETALLQSGIAFVIGFCLP